MAPVIRLKKKTLLLIALLIVCPEVCPRAQMANPPRGRLPPRESPS